MLQVCHMVVIPFVDRQLLESKLHMHRATLNDLKDIHAAIT